MIPFRDAAGGGDHAMCKLRDVTVLQRISCGGADGAVTERQT
jgi:hypothetical protein